MMFCHGSVIKYTRRSHNNCYHSFIVILNGIGLFNFSRHVHQDLWIKPPAVYGYMEGVVL